MITIRMKSDITDLDYETSVSPTDAYKILQILNPPKYPTLQEFIDKYCDIDSDYTKVTEND